jgi:hypothetical protein
MKMEHVLIDVAISGYRNVIQKEDEEILKYTAILRISIIM